jgi:equilibrative nucleoside transporter 1/2/3
MGSVPGDPELVRNTHTHTPHVPPDRFHLTYLILFLSGVGTLLPWNVFITERAYFELKLTVPPFPSAITNSFESVFGMTFMTANVLGLVWLVRGDTLSKLPTLARVPIPLLVMGGSCCATGALTDVKEMSGNASTTVTLATLLALGALTALVQGGTFHDASKLHPKYNNALMAGQAAAGVISATFALVCTAGIQGTTGHTSSGNTSSSGDAGGPGQDDARTRQLITNQARAYFYGAGVVLFFC